MNRSCREPVRPRSRASWLARVAFLGIFFLQACAQVPPYVPAAPEAQDLAAPPLFPTFLRHPNSAPVVDAGARGLPTVVFDPHVYADEEGYHLFHTAIFCRRGERYEVSWDPAAPGACNILETIGTVAYAFSADRGLSWSYRQTPVVVPPASGFDSTKIETPFVFRRGGTVYLTYTGDGDLDGVKRYQRFQIGIAELALAGRSLRAAMMDERITFERRPEPLVPHDERPGRFDNNVQEPSVVVREDGIEVYFVGLGLAKPEAAIDAPGQQIQGVALGRADFDLDWKLRSRSESGLVEGANITEMHWIDGAYHLFASSLVFGEFHRDEVITWSHSRDGVSWSEPMAILGPREGRFDSWGLMAPTVVVEPDRAVLFYTAFEVGPRRCFPVPADGRFGRPVDGDARCVFSTLGRAVSTPIATPR